jgi:hypothetical protein
MTPDELTAHDKAWLEGFIDAMEGKCKCGKPAVYQVAARIDCGCHSTDIYCREHATAQWYSSGMFGKICPAHQAPGKVTYHPRKLRDPWEPPSRCILCPAGNCDIWKD